MRLEDFEKLNGKKKNDSCSCTPSNAAARPAGFFPPLATPHANKSPDGHLGGVEHGPSRDPLDEYWDAYNEAGVTRDHFGFRIPRD